MSYAQALAIAAAALVLAEPRLPQHIYRHVQAAVSSFEAQALQRLQRHDTRVAALPDRHCIGRPKLLL